VLQDAEALDDDTIVVRRADSDVVFGVVVRLRGMGQVDVRLDDSTSDPDAEVLLTTELPRFASDPRPIDVSANAGQYRIRFARPGAIILKSQTSRGACP
jgi:hypothetical protein